MQSGRGGLYVDVLPETYESSALSANPEMTFQANASVLLHEPSSSLNDGLLFRAEWQLALRIAASKGLRKSEFLPRFLLYVCEQHLTGSTREMTEQHLGTQVFHRPHGYNPGEDNIVRSYARMLRKRLDDYFKGEGRDEPLRLVIPRGGYVPVFRARSAAESEAMSPSGPGIEETLTQGIEETLRQGITETVMQAAAGLDPSAVAADLVPEETSRSRSAAFHQAVRRHPWLLSLMLLIAGAVLASCGWMAVRSFEMKRQQGAAHALWLQLFRTDRNTLIVPADSNLGILQNLTGRLVSLEEYTNGTYLSQTKALPGIDPENFNDLRQQRYTSVVDLKITSALTQLPEFNPTRAEIRYARSITTEDLKNSNAILLGSVHSNPWVTLFEGKLNFVLQDTPTINHSLIVNKAPERGEQATYRNGEGPDANRTYGLVDYVPSLDGNGHVLIIQGLNMAATQAAADVLTHESAIGPILEQARNPDGSLSPFEVLVQTRSIGASAPESRIVGARVHRERVHPG